MNSTCDICGKEGVAAIINLEGAKMSVCRRCTSHGKILYTLREEPKVQNKTITTITPSNAKQTEEIVENFAKLIHSKRTNLGLPIAVVAERINEMESYLENIERGHMKPTIVVAKKLEKELGVKLVEMVTEEIGPTQAQKKSGEITLADFLEVRRTSKDVTSGHTDVEVKKKK